MIPTQREISAELIASAQEKDLSFLEETLPQYWEVKSVITDEGRRLFGVIYQREDVSSHFRPWVPKHLRAHVFHIMHDILHQGEKHTLSTIEPHYYWPTLVKDVGLWTRCCVKCQMSKVTRHNKQKLSSYPGDFPRLQMLHVDLMGPLEESQKKRYILSMRDRATGYLVCTALNNKSSACVIAGIKSSFISNFGIPTILVSDNGREFCSLQFTEFCKQLGIKHKRVTAYHPQANGFVERSHRTLKVALRALDRPEEWSEHLPLIQLLFNNQVSEPNIFSPFQLTFGQAGNIPGAFVEKVTDIPHPMYAGVSEALFFFQTMSNHRRRSRDLPTKEGRLERTLFQTEKVLVRVDSARSPLERRYRGPFVVLQRHEKFFTILGDDGVKNISIDRLKVFNSLPPEGTKENDTEEEDTEEEETDEEETEVTISDNAMEYSSSRVDES